MSTRPLRRFTEAGLQQFGQWLAAKDASDPPVGWLDDPVLSEPWGEGVTIEIPIFKDKLAFGQHLMAAIGERWKGAIDDAGLMAWLSLAFWESTMVRANGARIIGQASRHLMGVDNKWQSYTHSHRHLVRSAIFFVGYYGDDARVFLACHPSQATKIDEQIASRKTEGLPFSPSIARALNALYLDAKSGAIKRGASSDGRGSVTRFVKVVRQLDMTFDVQGLPGAKLVELLPAEFARFAKPA